jgi:hypothetical protein
MQTTNFGSIVWIHENNVSRGHSVPEVESHLTRYYASTEPLANLVDRDGDLHVAIAVDGWKEREPVDVRPLTDKARQKGIRDASATAANLNNSAENATGDVAKRACRALADQYTTLAKLYETAEWEAVDCYTRARTVPCSAVLAGKSADDFAIPIIVHPNMTDQEAQDLNWSENAKDVGRNKVTELDHLRSAQRVWSDKKGGKMTIDTMAKMGRRLGIAKMGQKQRVFWTVFADGKFPKLGIIDRICGDPKAKDHIPLGKVKWQIMRQLCVKTNGDAKTAATKPAKTLAEAEERIQAMLGGGVVPKTVTSEQWKTATPKMSTPLVKAICLAALRGDLEFIAALDAYGDDTDPVWVALADDFPDYVGLVDAIDGDDPEGEVDDTES